MARQKRNDFKVEFKDKSAHRFEYNTPYVSTFDSETLEALAQYAVRSMYRDMFSASVKKLQPQIATNQKMLSMMIEAGADANGAKELLKKNGMGDTYLPDTLEFTEQDYLDKASGNSDDDEE